MKLFLYIFLFFRLLIPCSAQHSFELKYGELDTTNSSRFTFEHQGYYFVAGGKGKSESNQINAATVSKISKTGEIIAEKTYPKADSNSSFYFGFPKVNGNLMFIGTLADTISWRKARYTYISELTPDLEMIWEKIDPIPSPPVDTTTHNVRNFLMTSDQEIILQGTIDTVLYGFNSLLYLTKFDMQGNRLQFSLFPSWKDLGNSSEMIFKADSTGFYLIGNLSLNSVVKDWIEFDLDLNIIDSGRLESESSYFLAPICAVRLKDGNIAIANQVLESGPVLTYGVEMRLYNTDLELIKTSIYYTENKVYTPLKRSIGLANDSSIWVAAFDWESPTGVPGKEDIIFLVYDDQIDLMGVKVHHGDSRYYISDLLACSDEGCLISGTASEYDGADYSDYYLLKVQLDDVITSTDVFYDTDYSVVIHPVPAKDRITLSNVPELCELLVYNVSGQLVASYYLNKGINQLEVGSMQPGIYFASILQNQQLIQTLKIIKQ
ncbi:MAG: T9SS type A sorting domain-containing protein [Bacteroidetes bacterium]|nr:T9SS type A sorting domain-containing protein [Bacteroidota bacterium]MBU1579444.1 T9SS type A sorting domain-containing protein [Bacteroidota bacterium]MBU2556947.1 T9SS type A sorting domain-containing protein [Bacteroidota bacterium]